MREMQDHVRAKHKEVSLKHMQKICRARLELYEQVVGAPLTKPENTAQQTEEKVLPIVVDGGFSCVICRHGEIFSSRDAILQHLAMAHSNLDVDAIEPLVPLLPKRQAATEVLAPRRRLQGLKTVADVDLVPPPKPLPFDQLPQGEDCAYPCEICGRSCLTEVDIINHLDSAHPPTREGADDEALKKLQANDSATPTVIHVICDLCNGSNKVFTLQSALYSHISRKHPSFNPAIEMQRMLDACRMKTVHVCSRCGKTFGSQNALDNHFSSVHGTVNVQETVNPLSSGNVWWCHECERGFSSERSLNGHMQAKHEWQTEMHPCPACKRIFGDVYSLHDHVSMTHKTLDPNDVAKKTSFKCDNCDRMFLRAVDAHKHAVKHHGKDPRAPIDAAPSQKPQQSEVDAPKRTRVVARRRATE
jgi:uncharacterized C2H2 Zn-finger protein